MSMSIASSGRHARSRGMSLPEVLMSVAISAMVLTGVVAAFVTSSRAVEINDQYCRASQSARICVNQIMTEARRSQAGVVAPHALELTLNTGEHRTYALDAVNKTLTMTLDSQVPPATYTMARNVTDAKFVTDGASISMTVTVDVNGNKLLLSGSALPRRSVTYK